MTEIKNTIFSLITDKSVGYDQILPYFLQIALSLLLPFFTFLLNILLQLASFPTTVPLLKPSLSSKTKEVAKTQLLAHFNSHRFQNF